MAAAAAAVFIYPPDDLTVANYAVNSAKTLKQNFTVLRCIVIIIVHVIIFVIIINVNVNVIVCLKRERFQT